LVQFVASPVVGRVSDKWGRKQMLVWGLGIFAGAEFLFAACNSLAAFNTSRAIDGLAAAMFVPTSMALAADITTPAQRAKVIGWLSASFSGGLILGPGIGGILAADNFKLPFWVAGVLGVISTIVAAIWLPSDEKVGVTHHEEHRQEKSTMTALKE
ncbi:MFS transporter, partial [Streptomyces xinghaiensis]